MKIITYQDIVNMNPCSAHRPSKYISEDWTGTALDVLDLPNVAPTEKLWVLRKVLDDKILRLFAVACARRALARIVKPDTRSLIAVNIAEAYANGRASKEELATACTAACAAYAAAHAIAAYATAAYAADAADAAAYAADAAAAADAADADADAARNYERSTQIADLSKIIKENICLDSTY
jgi:hypothetical protein